MTSRQAALNMVQVRGGGSLLGVIAKRTYQIQAGSCKVAELQVAMVEQPLPSEDRVTLVHDTDFALGRKQVDLVVKGRAHAHGKLTQFDAALRVGSFERQVRVFGARKPYRGHDDRIRFTEPEPVESVDLDWSSAYGGVDSVALAKYGDPIEALQRQQLGPYDPRLGLYAYPRNRAGKGFLIDASDEGLAGCALPNLEDPTQLLLPELLALGRADRWPAGPPVAGFGFLNYSYFPRASMLGLVPYFDYARYPALSFLEVRAGVLNPKSIAERIALPERMDVAAAQQAALFMRATAVKPGDAVQLSHLHPAQRSFAFTLSREVPRMALQLPDAQPIELVPQIRTLLLEPELDRICVVWVGEHTEATPVGPGKFSRVSHRVSW